MIAAREVGEEVSEVGGRVEFPEDIESDDASVDVSEGMDPRREDKEEPSVRVGAKLVVFDFLGRLGEVVTVDTIALWPSTFFIASRLFRNSSSCCL